MSNRHHRLLLTLVLSIYLLLALGYGVVVPLFETPDEHMHYFTAEFIAREGRLPTTRDAGLMAQEAAQPPLYYGLGSLIVRAVGSGDDQVNLWLNPKADPADPLGESLATPPINTNMFIHGPQEAWPWRGYALAAHLLRMMSAVLGLGTLLCIYAAGRTVWRDAPDRALLATALVAFLPQFAFIHGAVTNDTAITFFSAAAVWQLLRITNYELRITNEKQGDTAREGSLEARLSSLVSGCAAYVLLGITIGLAVLSKTAGLLLLVYCTGVTAARVWSRGGPRRWSRATAAGMAVALPALLLGGWWLVRNWTLYGDPTAANQFVLLAGGERPYTLYQVWLDMDRVWTSLFARFGWMNLRPPVWVWVVWNVIAILAATGAIWGIVVSIRHRKRPFSLARLLFHPAVILFGWFALVAAAWLQFMLRTPADQGRLFFPALIPLALGAAYGLSRWPRPWVQIAALMLALGTSIYSLAVVIPTAYALPPIVTTLPTEATPLEIAFPEGIDLVGVSVDTPVARPGEWVWLTLYWRARPDIAGGAPLVYLELFGREFERIGLQTNYHGRGNFPATLWPGGAIVADRMAVRVNGDAVAPVEAALKIKLAEDASGIDIGTVKIIPTEWPERVEPVARLGDAIELAAADLSTTAAAPGDTVEIHLRWQVAEPPGPARIHLFAHLGDPTQPPLAQADGLVMGGDYPSRQWAAGEVFDETVSLVIPADLAPGEYPVNIGLYDYDSGTRLPLVAGERIAGDALEIGRLTIR